MNLEQEEELELFPIETLPSFLREIAEELAYAYNSPREIVASSVMASLGFCLGRGAFIKSYHPDPIYGLIYMYLAALPGVGKSSIKPLLTPINSFVNEHRKRLRIHAESDLRNEWSDRKKEPTQKDINEYLGRGYGTLHTSIFTEEGLAQLLMNNDEYVVLLSTEAAGVIQAILGQGRQKMPLNNLLKHSYAGDYYSETYKSSEEANLLEPRMGILLLSTPSTFEDFISHPMIQKDGTLSRFLVYRHLGGRQKLPEDTREVPDRIIEQWERLTHFLLSKFWQKQCEPTEIKLSREAIQIHKEFYNQIVEQSYHLPEAIEETGVSTRVAENAGRIALILHFGLHQERGAELELSQETMANAIKLAEYLFNQSLKMLDSVIDQDHKDEVMIEELFNFLKKASKPYSLRDLDKKGVLEASKRKKIEEYLEGGEIVCWNVSKSNRPSLVISIANQPFIPDGVEFLKQVA